MGAKRTSAKDKAGPAHARARSDLLTPEVLAVMPAASHRPSKAILVAEQIVSVDRAIVEMVD